MSHRAPLARVGAGIAAIALVAAVLGCGQGERARGEVKCEGFEPVRVRITEDLFKPYQDPYFVWVWNERRTCGFSYLFSPSIGTANGGTCVLELAEYTRDDWPFDKLFILPTAIGGSCSDLGQHWHTGLEPPIGAVVLN